MKPLWAFLSLATLIAIVVLIWRSPETRDRISSVILGQPIASAAPPAAEPAEKPAEKSAKAAKSVRRYSKPAASPVAELPAVEPPKVSETPRIVDSVPTTANVKTDSAAVYSFNSSRSPVVRVLKKGEKVETNLEVIDSGGRWSLIQAEQQKSGFVRSENLERGQLAASRN